MSTGFRGSVTPQGKSKYFAEEPTPAQLPPGNPARTKRINTLVGRTFTASPQANASIATQLKAMNLSPDEISYVAKTSASRGNAAIKAQGEGVHGLIHQALPTLAHGAIDLAALATGVGDTTTTVKGPDGKPVVVHGGMIGIPFGGLLKGGIRTARVARDVEEAKQAVADAAKTARAEGFGPEPGGVNRPPLLKNGETTPETAGQLGADVREALSGKNLTKNIGKYEKIGAQIDNPVFGKSAAEARTVQNKLYHEERAARAAAAAKHLEAGNFEAAMHELKGALPKVDFQGFTQFDESAVRAMEAHIMEHPALQTYDKISAVKAVRKALGGKVPAPYEQRLLERAFGKTVTDQLTEAAGEINKWPKALVNLANVPRSLMASLDLSAPFRQGLVAGVSHPVIFAKAFKPMIKAARSEKYFQAAIQDEIHARPTFPLMEKAKVAFTDIGRDAQHGPAAMYQREEQFMSNYAERIPGLGRVVRGSDRAYVGFLNKIRADIFDHLVQEAAQQGHDVNSEKFLQSLGRFVNSATGRGNLGKLTEHTATLNALFFSPRLLASRINFLNPVYYLRLDPFARKEALKALLALGATATTVLEIAKAGGAQVNTDPTNADFAKIRVGNTRVDILGGFQQPVRLAAQLYSNKVTSSTTGKVIPLGSVFGKTSRYDVIMKFLQGKLSPIPALVVDATKGQDFTGKQLKWNDLSSYEREAASHMLPFLAQDLYDLEQTSGPSALGLAPLDLFGVGVQSYKAKPPKPKASRSRSTGSYFGGGSSGGSSGGYFGGSSSSGGSSYFKP